MTPADSAKKKITDLHEKARKNGWTQPVNVELTIVELRGLDNLIATFSPVHQ